MSKMRYTNEAARSCGNNSRAKVSVADAQIIARDVLLGAFGVLMVIGIPFVMAVLKQMGAW